MARNVYLQNYIQREHRHKGHRAHLILRNLKEFDLLYLQALMCNDMHTIMAYEAAACFEGYGPMAPCDSITVLQEQKQLCPTWHQDTNGVLTRGTMDRTKPCLAGFEFYYPYDLGRSPYILLVIHDVFTSLLEALEWKLADATPRRIVLDSAFMTGLRKVLGWVDLCDPTLGDLHPSLSNADHTARIINKLRNIHYPCGTGLEGAYHLLSEHRSLPPEKRYEFEIEAWFPEYLRSIVVTCAFTTFQSAEAHHILFNRIFSIVHEDTGEIVKFQHIHGVGFDTFMANGHIGQALGLGLYCEEMCRNMAGYCVIERSKALHALTPYEHLARFYRYCFIHFVRNVLALKGQVSLEVCTAMLSIAAAEVLPDFEGTLQQIHQGGKKAIDWLKNKESAGGFALAALYQPLSKIPMDIWRASPSTPNGNEQAHRSINRDGIMRGMQYDSRAMSGIELLCKRGIPSRDQPPTHFWRAVRAISRASAVQKCTIQAHDVELQTAYKQLTGLQTNVQTQTVSLKHAKETGKGIERAYKKLCKTNE
ncbi:hypothetical protein K439DRAFT_1624082 [Ramaria rubella]|nr:hypothetical protein K439DRAFT_1624082 [Ramaria rubella]